MMQESNGVGYAVQEESGRFVRLWMRMGQCIKQRIGWDRYRSIGRRGDGSSSGIRRVLGWKGCREEVRREGMIRGRGLERLLLLLWVIRVGGSFDGCSQLLEETG